MIVGVSIVEVARSRVGEEVTVCDIAIAVAVNERVAVHVRVKLAVTIAVLKAVGVNPAGVVVDVRVEERVTLTDGVCVRVVRVAVVVCVCATPDCVGVIVTKNIPVAATRVAAPGSIVAPYTKRTAVLVG